MIQETLGVREHRREDALERWLRQARFMGFGSQEREAVRATREPVTSHADEIAAEVYRHLLSQRETRSFFLLPGGRVNEVGLKERQRTFTHWIRYISALDEDEAFGRYLARVARVHVGEGPARAWIKPRFLTGAMGLLEARITSILLQEVDDVELLVRALPAWQKLLHLALDALLAPYERRWTLPVYFFGRLRELAGVKETTAALPVGGTVEEALLQVLARHPSIREELFEEDWGLREFWGTLEETGQLPEELILPGGLRLRPARVVLVNGRSVRHLAGFQTILKDGDRLSLFPPTR